MLRIEHAEVSGWMAAIRGMRNPLNSWDRMDSQITFKDGKELVTLGENDLSLMKRLCRAGSDHRKYLRMLTVTMDITAMQPWWFEFDTYKVGTVRNSCSKMHKIHAKPFTLEDFASAGLEEVPYAKEAAEAVISACERLRQDFNATKEKKYWRALIELLPEGYEMRATVQLNYEVLLHMYWARKDHKLQEWHVFCDFVKTLPYFSEICLGEA